MSSSALMSTGLRAMFAATAQLNTTAHNIANVNTTGFKESRAEFAEVFSSTGYGLMRNGIGAGVRLTRVIGTPSLPELDPFLMLDEFGAPWVKISIAKVGVARGVRMTEESAATTALPC